MTLTVRHCLDHIQHRLGTTDGGAGLSHGINGLQVVNMAGAWVTTARRWKWLQRQSASLDLVAGQSLVALPANFETLIAIQPTSTLGGMEPVSLETLLQYEQGILVGGPWRYYAVLWDGDTALEPKLRVYPTPTEDAAGVYQVFYRAKWAKRSSDDERILIPEFMEPLFVELVREYAAGWEEGDVEPLDSRLTRVRLGPQWEAAVEVDAHIQRSYGVLKNGAAEVETSESAVWRFGTVNGPS